MAVLDVRLRFFRLIWLLITPLLQYIRWSPIQPGKNWIIQRLIWPMLPPDKCEFTVGHLGEYELALRYREAIGFSFLLYGNFETAEVTAICELAKPGSVAVDIGANVGIFTIPLSQAVGSDGKVLAFEPHSENRKRLSRHVEHNGLVNVHVDSQALGDREGPTVLALSDDPAFGSTTQTPWHRPSPTSLRVEMTTLTKVWQAAQSPHISVIKIDVEGGELYVLHGAIDVIRACRPTILLEAQSDKHLAAISRLLKREGYRATQPVGFESWNYLFVAE